MILEISLRTKAGVPKTLVKRKLRLHSLYFRQNTLMLRNSVICILFTDFVRFAFKQILIASCGNISGSLNNKNVFKSVIVLLKYILNHEQKRVPFKTCQ